MKKWIYNLLTVLFVAVFVISAGYLGFYYIDAYRQQGRYDDLAEIMEQDTTPRPTVNQNDGTEATDPIPEPTFVEVTDPETGEPIRLLSKFAELYVLNNDIVGWLTIPGTEINYPVMQTPNTPDFYLKHNFDKESSARGCLYAQEICDVFAPSDNITIYGHRMRDGSMFAKLDEYMDRSFFEKNPYIYFDTLSGLHTYKIAAVFLTTATADQGFAYHEFVTAENPEDFNAFMDTCTALSLYDTGVTPTYGDKLITLSTCEYSQTNGRLVVVAMRIA